LQKAQEIFAKFNNILYNADMFTKATKMYGYHWFSEKELVAFVL